MPTQNMRSHASAQADARIIADKAYRITGAALQAANGFKPTVYIQSALGHARDAIKHMAREHLIERDRRTVEKIRAVLGSTA
jgi:hypothetical protein